MKVFDRPPLLEEPFAQTLSGIRNPNAYTATNTHTKTCLGPYTSSQDCKHCFLLHGLIQFLVALPVCVVYSIVDASELNNHCQGLQFKLYGFSASNYNHSPSVARRKTPRPAPTDDPGPGPFHDQAESRKLVTDFIKKAPDPKI